MSVGLWGEKPYYSLDYYLKQTFGGKVYKITLNGGMTCPNRDGKLGTGGCIFCSAGGSGEFAAPAALPITEQIAFGKSRLSERIRADRYIAYFQAFTNTYAPVDYLRKIFTEAISCPDVAVLSVATRPDCLGDNVLELLSELNRIKPVWVELGLQSAKESTAQYIRRGYPLECFDRAVFNLKSRGIVTVVHTILGLPFETEEDVLNTICHVNRSGADGIKLQLLHVLENTDLANEYRAGKFRVLEEEEYVALVCRCIAHLDESIVIHRLTGDGPSEQLIAPLWSRSKMTVLNEIHHRLKMEGIRQGCEKID